jgi:hypothetical protein
MRLCEEEKRFGSILCSDSELGFDALKAELKAVLSKMRRRKISENWDEFKLLFIGLEGGGA